ncbi:effector binding domain-containing protein [Virgibacillus sp. YIM 98842]|uniref:GyrI-like domain-containing protein n=1 Tax=Virgibacillus sp. YIM 98842 TaxID=2663533 RepID=UPI0013D94876|nr:effector binding domain-containing protein [Virgibacillus sp. YIM 98842]
MLKIGYDTVKKQQFEAIGLKWEGTFSEAEAGGIKSMMKEMHERMNEIDHVVQSENLIGLSYNAQTGNDRFVPYSVVEVAKISNIPEGVMAISVPETTFVRMKHLKGQDIRASYRNIYQWIAEKGYVTSTEYLTHLEIYPVHQDSYSNDPNFTIMIPITMEE